jgi:hypothetical protein
MALFLLSLLGHWLMGWHFENAELSEHGAKALTLAQYTADPQFLSTVFENWESEFLQMGMYVLLTAILVQKGSAESKDPDEPPRSKDNVDGPPPADAPAVLHSVPVMRWLYAHSLCIVLLGLFVCSFGLHWRFSAREAASSAMMHGEKPLSMSEYLATSQLWFESFQNWQSEFLSIAVLVVLSIFLRQRGSPESKAVAEPHAKTGSG